MFFFMMGLLCILVCSSLFVLVYDYFVGLNTFPLSSELYARAPKESDLIMLGFVNTVISVASGFLYIFVERLDKESNHGHVIGIAISTALAPPASAWGVLLSAYFIQPEYYEEYNIAIPFLILWLNTYGIMLGALIAYILTGILLKNRKREDSTPHSTFGHRDIGSMCW